MKTKHLIILSFCILFTFNACQNLTDILPTELTEAEIVDGLKSALTVGADSSVANTSKVNGYLQDEVIKLLLPTEAQGVITSLRSSIAGESIYQYSIKTLEDSVITSLNRSAEDAAVLAKPILINAITNITIADGKKILFDGIDTAATNYLRINTFSSLKTAFSPKIDASLNKALFARFSANYYWSAFTTGYNTVANSPANFLLNLKPLKTQSLGSYATERALEGLFVKIKAEEISIRKDPTARVTDILVKVFGKLDK